MADEKDDATDEAAEEASEAPLPFGRFSVRGGDDVPEVSPFLLCSPGPGRFFRR